MGGSKSQVEADQDFDLGYHKAAMRTAAGPEVFHFGQGQNYSSIQFAHDLSHYIRAARVLDRWKSRLFYGKDKMVGNGDIDKLLRDPDLHLSMIENPQLIHGILGVASEAGEMAEDLLGIMAGNDPNANIEREQGDVDWFQELIAEARGVSIVDCRYQNIERLKARFPNAFSEEDAVARADEG